MMMALSRPLRLPIFTIFSIAPLLLIVIAIAGLLFGARWPRRRDHGPVRGLMGKGQRRRAEDRCCRAPAAKARNPNDRDDHRHRHAADHRKRRCSARFQSS